jgi:glycine dehydrogenase
VDAQPTGFRYEPLAMTLDPVDTFARRHIGPSPQDLELMLKAIGQPSLEALIDKTVPASIRLKRPLNLTAPKGEHALLQELRAIADKNQIFTSHLGQGYFDTVTPGVILRNVLLNPGWYTAYTPYQASATSPGSPSPTRRSSTRPLRPPRRCT